MTQETFENGYAAVLSKMLVKLTASGCAQGKTEISILTRDDPQPVLLTTITGRLKLSDRWHGESAGVLVTSGSRAGYIYTLIPYEEITAIIGNLTGNVAGYK